MVVPAYPVRVVLRIKYYEHTSFSISTFFFSCYIIFSALEVFKARKFGMGFFFEGGGGNFWSPDFFGYGWKL